MWDFKDNRHGQCGKVQDQPRSLNPSPPFCRNQASFYYSEKRLSTDPEFEPMTSTRPFIPNFPPPFLRPRWRYNHQRKLQGINVKSSIQVRGTGHLGESISSLTSHALICILGPKDSKSFGKFNKPPSKLLGVLCMGITENCQCEASKEESSFFGIFHFAPQ